MMMCTRCMSRELYLMMVAVGMIVKNQLLLLAFVLMEGENNKSWKLFLSLVRKQCHGFNYNTATNVDSLILAFLMRFL
jgi:hypothetical protein